MIRFQCPTCHKNLKSPDEGAGRKTQCPRCGQRLCVPPPVKAQGQNKTIMGQPTPSPSEWLNEVQVAEEKSKPSSALQQPSGHVLFKCPTCHSPLNIAEQRIGRMVDCPKCQTTFAALTEDNDQNNVQFDSVEYSQAEARERESVERRVDEKYCHECGAVIRARVEICPNCGVRQPARFGDGPPLEPHRGTAILVLGILGLSAFWPLGLIAWLWANEDLRKMKGGIMDPEGRGSTQAGRICGMIASILVFVALGLMVLYLFMLFCMCGVMLPR